MMSENAAVEKRMDDGLRTPVSNPDEINLLEYIYVLVKNKWLIIGLTLLGFIGGHLLARLKGPTWVAEAVIAPKEREAQKSPNLSSFGAIGGLVASQLNIGGDVSLDKIEQLLDSRDFNTKIIRKYDLLPSLYRNQWPKKYRSIWDSSANTWKRSFTRHDSLGFGGLLRDRFLKQTTGANAMTIQISSRDSALSLDLANYYIAFLDEDIKTAVRTDAKENVLFLEKQLVTIADPLLREKIQTLIADEIEKTMLVSKEAFRIVDPVFLSRTFREKKLYPIVFGGGMFFFGIVIVIFFHVLSTAEKTEEDRRLIERIKKELLITGGKKR